MICNRLKQWFYHKQFWKLDLTAPNPLYSLIFLMSVSISYTICMSFVCQSYAYVLLCHLYVIRMSLICTRMSFVCHFYVFVNHLCALVYHLYVSRMYSYVICMTLVCTRMSPVCTQMSSVCHSYVLVCQSSLPLRRHRHTYPLFTSMPSFSYAGKWMALLYKIKSINSAILELSDTIMTINVLFGDKILSSSL